MQSTEHVKMASVLQAIKTRPLINLLDDSTMGTTSDASEINYTSLNDNSALVGPPSGVPLPKSVFVYKVVLRLNYATPYHPH